MSTIASRLFLRYPPLALYYADAAPDGAIAESARTGEKGGWNCVMFKLARAFTGATVYFSREGEGCVGGKIGMGFGAEGVDFPGGPIAFACFLSNGNQQNEEGMRIAEEMRSKGAPREMVEQYLKGEGFKKNPDLAMAFLENSPRITPWGAGVVVTPLAKLEKGVKPDVVIMLANALQISALVVLANYGRATSDNVIVPFCSGCQSIALYPLAESGSPKPRAVIGLTDISARLYMKKILGEDLLAFSMPYQLYEQMESDAPESFLNRPDWGKLAPMLETTSKR